MIEVQALTKRYQDAQSEALLILDQVNLSIAKESSAAIVGPSGSGKSTLLNLIGALDKPDSGSIKIDGVDITQFNETEQVQFRQKQIGFIFQKHHLLPQCTLLENVLLPKLTQGEINKDSEAYALSLLEEVGLSDRCHHFPTQLSGGECQRGAVVRALIHKPAIVLADEPTGSLDADRAHSLIEMLLDLKKRHGMTLLVVTHADDIAAKMEQRVQLSQRQLKVYS